MKNKKFGISKNLNATLKKVKFSVKVSQADKVMLAGDFNNWDSSSIPLSKNRQNIWEKELKLKPGRYEYKFIVDGNWITDPNNSKKIQNSLGTENSVIEV